MACDHLSTLRIMQLQTEPLPTDFHLTVTNALESWAQRVLVSQEGYPHLYRKDSFSPDDNEYVHLVLVGATQMAYALAITTAHIAHYPNFLTKQKRTRITFITSQPVVLDTLVFNSRLWHALKMTANNRIANFDTFFI